MSETKAKIDIAPTPLRNAFLEDWHNQTDYVKVKLSLLIYACRLPFPEQILSWFKTNNWDASITAYSEHPTRTHTLIHVAYLQKRCPAIAACGNTMTKAQFTKCVDSIKNDNVSFESTVIGVQLGHYKQSAIDALPELPPAALMYTRVTLMSNLYERPYTLRGTEEIQVHNNACMLIPADGCSHLAHAAAILNYMLIALVTNTQDTCPLFPYLSTLIQFHYGVSEPFIDIMYYLLLILEWARRRSFPLNIVPLKPPLPGGPNKLHFP